MRKAQQKFDQSSRKCRQSLAKVSLKCRQTLAVSSAKTRPNLPQNFGQRSRQLGPNFWYFESSRRNTGATFFTPRTVRQRTHSAAAGIRFPFRQFPSSSSLARTHRPVPCLPPLLIAQLHLRLRPVPCLLPTTRPSSLPPVPSPDPDLQFPSSSSLPPVPSLQHPAFQFPSSSSLPPVPCLQSPSPSSLPPVSQANQYPRSAGFSHIRVFKIATSPFDILLSYRNS